MWTRTTWIVAHHEDMVPSLYTRTHASMMSKVTRSARREKVHVLPLLNKCAAQGFTLGEEPGAVRGA